MATSLQHELQQNLSGEVRFDALARTLYSTDASMYEIVPAGVVCPRHVADVVATVEICAARGMPIVARGAGTGLAGGAVGTGVQIDFSRHMHTISKPDLEAGTVRVQPGAVLDELNALLASAQLQFAPDVATASRATIGGMIANNSCGAHSLLYGRTVDHVVSLTVVLPNGTVTTWPSNTAPNGTSARTVEDELCRIVDAHSQEIHKRFPTILRRNGGYALDLLRETRQAIDPTRVICGSEGTLCLVTEAVLQLTPLPACKALLLLEFDSVLDALSTVPLILRHAPAAIELLDHHVLAGAARDASAQTYGDTVDTSAPALLIVEFFDKSREQLSTRICELRRELKSDGTKHTGRTVLDPDQQRIVWDMRKRGLGMLMSKPGDVQSCAFVEDTAVDPSHLRDYIERFQAILHEEGARDTAFYAHASVGEIHVRPALNLKTATGVSQVLRIAERVSDLALEFGGSMTGEHGDGIVRSCWIEKMYGPVIAGAFKEIKQAFDPRGLMNPGKIVGPLPMTEHLRYGPEYSTTPLKTHLDLRKYGGFSGLAEMCSGVGQCRQKLVGTMCPSFMATGDEVHSTRARANALRVALSSHGQINGLSDPALDEVMDLCLMCKACKTECPTGVDLAAMKAEWLSQRHLRDGVPRAARFFANAPQMTRLASRFPRLANIMLGSPAVRALLERRYGMDRRIPPHLLATTTFERRFRRQRKQGHTRNDGRPSVVYLIDTWANYYTPNVGIAAVRLLEAAGFHVIVPHYACCGRTLISKGLLADAKNVAETNLSNLARFADRQIPIVGTEPSCILTLCDEYPRLVPGEDTLAVARLAQPLESFLESVLDIEPDRICFAQSEKRILYHGHCHQKAIVGGASAARLLNRPPGHRVEELDAGCCGMAGAFGHEKEHYDVAHAIGAQRLFPAIETSRGAHVAVSGFSCREQITHHTDATPRHVVEFLADALADSPLRSQSLPRESQ